MLDKAPELCFVAVESSVERHEERRSPIAWVRIWMFVEVQFYVTPHNSIDLDLDNILIRRSIPQADKRTFNVDSAGAILVASTASILHHACANDSGSMPQRLL
jgi:hypothetical protein